MLRISKLTNYGIVIMSSLAAAPNRVHAAHQIAELTHVALPTVAKVLKRLHGADLVLSIRGPKGGYRLARPATDISVADVVSALEGPVSLTECSTDDSNCEQADVCSLRTNWTHINEAIRNALESISLDEMVRPMVTVQDMRSGHAVRSIPAAGRAGS